MDDVLNAVPTDLYLADTTRRGTRADSIVRVAIQANQIAVQLPGADTIEVDGVSLIILPPDPVDDANENDNSVLVRLEFGQFSMLFTGDAEVAERDWLVANHSVLLDTDVLKASHHARHNGTSGAWLDAVSPERIVISAGLHRGFKHPHEEAVLAYEEAVGDEARVYCTNRHGTITIYGFPDGRIRDDCAPMPAEDPGDRGQGQPSPPKQAEGISFFKGDGAWV